MSSIYHTEPPTHGKVVVRTTFGELDIELWPKEAPLACRNFLQLAMEGYFDKTNVVRIVKGFMVQMGDPTGTGFGGESIWGKPFKDEVHGRIKFNHRGLVAMANGNKPHSNQSQFFITLDACDWLNGKHTIFGKVTGNTIFNLLRMGEVEVDSSEKPIEAIKIISVELILNPFEDIIPRVTSKTPTQQDRGVVADETRKTKASKNSNLLSFGDDEGDEEETIAVKFKSRHGLRKKAALDAPQMLTEESSKVAEISRGREPQVVNQSKSKDYAVAPEIPERKDESELNEGLEDPNTIVEEIAAENRKAAIQKASEEISRLKETLKGGGKKAVKVITGEEAIQRDQSYRLEALTNPLEARRLKYVKRKQEFGDRSEETMKKLQNFTESLKRRKQLEVASTISERKNEVTYSGQILEEDDNGREDMSDWFVGKLKCKKHIDEEYRNH